MGAANRTVSLSGQAEAVARDLVAVLDTLPPASWSGPSDCEGWSMAAVVAHLVMVEELLGSSIRRGLRGDVSPRPHAFENRAAWVEYRGREISRLSLLPPADLCEQFRAGLEPMREALAGLAATDLPDGPGWHPGGLQPLTWFAGQWLFEVALHDWDLRVALDPGAVINPAAQPGLGPELRTRMPRYFKAAGGLGPGGAVRIELFAAGGEGSPAGTLLTAWLARIGDDGLELLDDESAEPRATIRSDPASYALVQTARRPAGAFQADGRWRVSGDRGLVERLVSSFAGF